MIDKIRTDHIRWEIRCDEIGYQKVKMAIVILATSPIQYALVYKKMEQASWGK